jgi:ADP-heptose:LPS heptosyltransferase
MTPSTAIVVKPGSLGDIVHTLPAIHFLKSTFPATEFFWIANEEWVPLLQDNADLKGVITFPRSRFRGPSGIYHFFRWCGQLSGLQPDLVLDFQGLLRSAWISRSLKPRLILGLSDSREVSRYFYDERATVRNGQHAVDRYLELAKLAGADITGTIAFPLPAGRPIQSLELPHRFVALHPFSRGTDKSLSAEEVNKLVQALTPHPVIVVGRSAEQVSVPGNGISLVNRTDLSQLIWLFHKAAFIVSVDSGPMHIGAAITSSLLSVHTWSNPRLVGPYNPDTWVWKGGRIWRVRSLSTDVCESASTERPNPVQIAEFVHEQLLP